MGLNIKLPNDCRDVIKNFIASKVRDAKSDGVIIGLSGGLDSAVVAKLCVDAVGKEKVILLLMPENKEKDEHFKDAEDFAKDLGTDAVLIEIEPIIRTFLNSTDYKNLDNISLGNLKARIRSVLLYIHANTKNLLVAGTSNKSELMVGYFTKYGDGGTDISPIGDLYKTQVRELARELDIPKVIIEKIPTAGFFPDQNDESELGLSYKVLDRILLGLELRLPLDSIAETVSVTLEEVIRIKDLSFRSRHKRKFTKIPKIGIKTVGTDLRE